MVDGRFAKFALTAAALLMLSGCMFEIAPRTFDRPYARSGSDTRKAMAAAVEANDRPALSRRALELAWMGGTLTDASFDRIAPLLDSPTLRRARTNWLQRTQMASVPALRRWYASNRTTYVTPDRFADAPADYRLVEGVAWDAKEQRLFAGTVVDGRLAYRDTDDQWHEVPIGSPRGGLFGMAIDAKRRLLWIATGSLEQVAVPGERMTGLIAVDLDSLKVVRRVPLAPGAPGAVGDVAVAADGTVYASNVLSGAIHRCLPGCTVLEDLIAPGIFRNPQGLAVSPNGKHLYIADYISGLWLADPRTGTAKPMRISEPTMLEGIDGLLISDGTLIAVQNGTNPRRIAIFSLDRDGDLLLGTRVWVTFAPDAGEPTLATLDADRNDLIVVGDGQWERYGPGGVLKDSAPPRPTPILRVTMTDIIVT